MADGNRPPHGVPQTILELMPDNPAARDNPHALLKALRETCPVMRDETIKTWLLTRYRDIRETSNDRSFVRHPSKAEAGTLAGGGGAGEGQAPASCAAACRRSSWCIPASMEKTLSFLPDTDGLWAKFRTIMRSSWWACMPKWTACQRSMTAT